MKKFLAAVSAVLMMMSFTACGAAAQGTATAEGEQGGGALFWIIYIVVIGAFVYFLMIRPNKKQKKEQAELFASMAIGDSVLTSSGMYGVIIDLTDDTVIVEFGSNKNCRIPMQKAAIVQVEKPNYTVTKDETKEEK